MKRFNLKYRVNLDFIGTGKASSAYGGNLEAWSFYGIDGEQWFSDFRQHVLSCLGREYLPIYRMADGEYRFLMGRKYNFYKKPLWKELAAVTAEKIRIKNPDKWKTSWGEVYSPHETKSLRVKLLNQISDISNVGYLACYINDNGLNAFTEYNSSIESFFSKNSIRFDFQNYVPFHFVVGLLVNEGYLDFFENRNILIVSGTDEGQENKILKNVKKLGVRSVEFLRISKTSSMKDILDLSKIRMQPDLCLVAAGIGSANILCQLKPLATVTLDIGGYINCFIDTSLKQHGGVFGYPLL